MVANQEDVFYYITLMNENYEHPAMAPGIESGILKGMYLLAESKSKSKARVQLLGSGTILREVEAAAVRRAALITCASADDLDTLRRLTPTLADFDTPSTPMPK